MKTMIRTLVIVALLLSAAPPTITRAQAELTGGFSGEVRSTFLGNLSGSRVCANNYDTNEFVGCALLDIGPYPIGNPSAISYVLSGLPAGRYHVHVEPNYGHAKQVYNHTYDWGSATPVIVTGGSNTPGIDFDLEPGGSLSGHVEDADGQPVRGAFMRALDYNGTAGWSATSDANGYFMVTGLLSGAYRVEANPPSGMTGYGRTYYPSTQDFDQALPVVVTAPGNTGPLAITLAGIGSISGLVTDQASGQAVRGAVVCVDSLQTGMNVACLMVEADGTYRVSALETGRYHVHVEPPLGYAKQVYRDTFDWADYTPVDVVAPYDTAHIDFRLVPGNALPVRVTGSNGEIVSDVSVWAQLTTGPFAGAVWHAFWTQPPDLIFTGLLPGDYLVWTAAPDYPLVYYPGTPMLDQAMPVVITVPQPVPGIVFYLGGQTAAGELVVAEPRPEIEVTFLHATSDGFTYAMPMETLPPDVPPDFRVLDQAYQVGTTAGFDRATLCFDYDDTGLTAYEEAGAELRHLENNVWVNITDPGYPDTLNNRICGTVTSFSPFAILVPLPFNFTGFFQPVDDLPVLNVANAGRAIPVKFSLAGNQGLAIFTAGYPRSQAITCGSSALLDGIEETVTAGASGLTYDPVSDHYTYVWKTEKAWAGTCRQLVIPLVDGTYHRANFKFK